MGFLAGIGSWMIGGGLLWLIAALFIGAVVPFALTFAMPTNKRLLSADRGLTPEEIRELLERWGKIHTARTVLSAVATVLMFWRLLNADDAKPFRLRLLILEVRIRILNP
jgi:hypothetical protein